jgi:hypothetical protein
MLSPIRIGATLPTVGTVPVKVVPPLFSRLAMRRPRCTLTCAPPVLHHLHLDLLNLGQPLPLLGDQVVELFV